MQSHGQCDLIDSGYRLQPTYTVYSVNRPTCTLYAPLYCAVATQRLIVVVPYSARPCGSQILPSESFPSRVDSSFHVADVTVWNGRPDAARGRVEAVETAVVGWTAELTVDEVLNVDETVRCHH